MLLGIEFGSLNYSNDIRIKVIGGIVKFISGEFIK